MVKFNSTIPINHAGQILSEVQDKESAEPQKNNYKIRVTSFVQKRFEIIFISLILIATFILQYLTIEKLSFLDFYFIPIIMGGYYLGRRNAILAAVLSVLIVYIYFFICPPTATIAIPPFYFYLRLVSWGCLLILAGGLVGGMHEKLQREVETIRLLNRELQGQQNELNQAHAALKDYSENLEVKVKKRSTELDQANASLREYSENLEIMVRQRTDELEKSKASLEALKEKVETALHSTMDSSVIKLLLEGRLRNEKRTVSILFSDLVNFSTYSEDTPPEVVIRDINCYLAAMEPVLLAYNGHIDRYMGDGIMCEFGAPMDYSMYRLMSVLAAVKMQEKMAQMCNPWQMRIGVASGTTIIGLVGNKRQSYTAMGDVVNISARLQKACTPGRVLIDRFTYETVSRFIEARNKREVSTKDIINMEMELTLKELHAKSAAEPDNPDHYYHIGKIHMDMNELLESLQYFERAVQLNPDNDRAKIAYAEASIKMRENDKINIRGRRQRIEVYEVLGIKNPLDDRNKVSEDFARQYRHVADMIQIPEDVLLPVEALDGSIGHGKLVAIFSYAIASCLGLAERAKADILTAGYAADIGKETVPHHLLTRSGTLTSRELETLRMHPEEGANALLKMGHDNENILQIVRHSHEHYNGTGHPEALKGESIPIGSRIIAAADTYAAMISWRPYRDPWERSVALDEIVKGAEAGIYDRKVVEALIRVVS